MLLQLLVLKILFLEKLIVNFMKKKKKIFILSDGRIFFSSTIPFYQKPSIVISLIDSFLITNWITIFDKSVYSHNLNYKKN